jgi:hypothetical protein
MGPFNMSFSVIAQITDAAKQRIASGLRDGKSFSVDHFVVTDGGHVPLQPTESVAPDPSATDCAVASVSGNQFGPVPISSSAMLTPFCPAFVCNLSTGDANFGISSLCLVATIVSSQTLDDPEIGQQFLFAQANFPLKVKTPVDNFTLVVQIAL